MKRSRRRYAHRRVSRAALAAIVITSARAVAEERTRAEESELEDRFLDVRGNRVPFSSTYDAWFGRSRYSPNCLGALTENLVIAGLENFVYWFDAASSGVDWQYPDLASKLSSREVFRFDDNLPRTNFLLHPAAGGAHYLFTRVNGFGVPASFGVAAAFSALYELVFEWREVVSINDLVVTPVGGLAFGEFLNQLTGYLNSAPAAVRVSVRRDAGTVVRGLAAGTLGFPRAVRSNTSEPRALAKDSLGLSSAYRHDFQALGGVGWVETGADRAERLALFDARAALWAMPGMLRPGRFGTWFWDGNFTRMRLRLGSSDSSRHVDLSFESDLFGYYGQDIGLQSSGVAGGAYTFGATTALRYVDRLWLGRRDIHAALAPLRPSARLWFKRNSSSVEFSGGLGPEFSEIRSLAYETWSAVFGAEGTKSSLRRHGYYHALGLSGHAGVELASGGAALGGAVRYSRYESIDGLERMQEEVTRDVHGTDGVLELSAYLAVQPPQSIAFARLEADWIRRTSEMDPVRVTRSDQRYGILAGVRF